MRFCVSLALSFPVSHKYIFTNNNNAACISGCRDGGGSPFHYLKEVITMVFPMSGHPWIVDDSVAPDKPIDSAVLSRLKHFSAMNKLKKMALRVWNLFVLLVTCSRHCTLNSLLCLCTSVELVLYYNITLLPPFSDTSIIHTNTD